MTPREKHQAKLSAILIEADQSFANTHDVMEALTWVRLALSDGVAVPPRIAAWFSAAIVRYRTGKAATLDVALGLAGSGKANPRRQMRERGKLENALAEMTVLHALGATIPQAAAMVERLSPDYKASTLCDRYARSGLGKRALLDRPALQIRWLPSELNEYLQRFPDRPESVAQAKRAIMRMYSKVRASRAFARG